MEKEIISVIKNGGIVILPTDTIYGITCSALLPKSVEKIYRLRRRNLKKPCIILITGMQQLKLFNIKLAPQTQKLLKSLWPNPVSVVLPTSGDKLKYLHRGTNTLAFRMPKKPSLQKLLKQTGPLIAPSANCEGEVPSQTVTEAKKYFGTDVDLYVDGGNLPIQPSTVVKITGNSLEVLRKGSFKVPKPLP